MFKIKDYLKIIVETFLSKYNNFYMMLIIRVPDVLTRKLRDEDVSQKSINPSFPSPFLAFFRAFPLNSIFNMKIRMINM